MMMVLVVVMTINIMTHDDMKENDDDSPEDEGNDYD